jgi:hypothetical protein
MEFAHGFGGVEKDTAGFLGRGHTETRHRLQAIRQAKTVHYRHWPGVNLAVYHRRRQGAGYHLIQHNAAPLHVEVKWLSMQIRDTAYSECHTSLPYIVYRPPHIWLTVMSLGSDCREPMLQRQARGASVIGVSLLPTWCIIGCGHAHTPHVGTAQSWNKWTCAAMKPQVS